MNLNDIVNCYYSNKIKKNTKANALAFARLVELCASAQDKDAAEVALAQLYSLVAPKAIRPAKTAKEYIKRFLASDKDARDSLKYVRVENNYLYASNSIVAIKSVAKKQLEDGLYDAELKFLKTLNKENSKVNTIERLFDKPRLSVDSHDIKICALIDNEIKEYVQLIAHDFKTNDKRTVNIERGNYQKATNGQFGPIEYIPNVGICGKTYVGGLGFEYIAAEFRI